MKGAVGGQTSPPKPPFAQPSDAYLMRQRAKQKRPVNAIGEPMVKSQDTPAVQARSRDSPAVEQAHTSAAEATPSMSNGKIVTFLEFISVLVAICDLAILALSIVNDLSEPPCGLLDQLIKEGRLVACSPIDSSVSDGGHEIRSLHEEGHALECPAGTSMGVPGAAVLCFPPEENWRSLFLEHYATKASTCLVVGLIMLELLVWRFEPIAYCRDWVRNTFDWIILLASLAGELYELHEESLPEEEGTSAALRIALFLRLLKVARVGHVFIELSAIFCDADDHESE